MPYRLQAERPYSQDDVINAVAEVKSGISILKVSQKYRIPTSTLADKVYLKYEIGKSKSGPPSVLSSEQEQRIADYAIFMSNAGFGITIKEIPNIVKNILDSSQALDGHDVDKKPFPNNKPSRSWVYRFLKRFPEVSLRKPDNSSRQMGQISEEIIITWFVEFEIFLNDQHGIKVREFFSCENRDRIFYVNVVAFPLTGASRRHEFMTGQGTKNLPKVRFDSKEQISVLVCASANGELCKPLVICPGERPLNYRDAAVNLIDSACSPDGRITADIFFGWLVDVLYPTIKDTASRPLIIFMDGHPFCVNIAVTEFCRDHRIILYRFPPHANHLMETLDQHYFNLLKQLWNDNLSSSSKNESESNVDTDAFIRACHEAIPKAGNKQQNVVKGFQNAGLVPFYPNAVVDSEKLNSEYLKNIPPKKPLKVLSGIRKAILCMEESLPESLQISFKRRWEEHLEENEENAILWKIYKKLKTLEENFSVDNIQKENERISQTMTQKGCNSFTPPTHEIQKSGSMSPEEKFTPFEAPAIENFDESGVNIRRSSKTCEFSPPENYQEITDHIYAAKNASYQSQFPDIVSEKDIASAVPHRGKQEMEEMKKDEERIKNEDKIQLNKPNQKSDDNIINTSFSQSSDAVLIIVNKDCNKIDLIHQTDFDKKCHVCEGSENKKNNNAWISCCECPKWFHEACVQSEVLSDMKIRNSKFYCHSCGKKTSKTRGKKSNLVL